MRSLTLCLVLSSCSSSASTLCNELIISLFCCCCSFNCSLMPYCAICSSCISWSQFPVSSTTCRILFFVSVIFFFSCALVLSAFPDLTWASSLYDKFNNKVDHLHIWYLPVNNRFSSVHCLFHVLYHLFLLPHQLVVSNLNYKYIN